MSIHLPSKDNNYYWRLELRDGRVIDIPPRYVDLVKRKMDSRQPIHTNDGSIPFAQVVSFNRSSKEFTDRTLMAGVAQAFNEPLVTDEGEVKAMWAKKRMSRNEYEKQAKGSTYRKIGEEDSFVIVAFVIPVHRFDKSYMEECTDAEIRLLERF